MALHVPPGTAEARLLAPEGDEPDFHVVGDGLRVLLEEPAHGHRQGAGREIVGGPGDSAPVFSAPDKEGGEEYRRDHGISQGDPADGPQADRVVAAGERASQLDDAERQQRDEPDEKRHYGDIVAVSQVPEAVHFDGAVMVSAEDEQALRLLFRAGLPELADEIQRLFFPEKRLGELVVEDELEYAGQYCDKGKHEGQRGGDPDGDAIKPARRHVQQRGDGRKDGAYPQPAEKRAGSNREFLDGHVLGTQVRFQFLFQYHGPCPLLGASRYARTYFIAYFFYYIEGILGIVA